MHAHHDANKTSRNKVCAGPRVRGSSARGQGVKGKGKGKGKDQDQGKGTCNGSLDTSARQKALERLLTA